MDAIESILQLLGTLIVNIEGFEDWIPIVLDTARLYIDMLPSIFGSIAGVALIIYIIKIILGAST